MTKSILAAMALILLASSAALAEEKVFPATLKAHAILPANTIIAAPANAADYLKTSGKFATADRKRAVELGSVGGKDGVRPTGLSLPLNGQPMQGFSGIKAMEDDTFWSLSDNGFGNKLNSTDAMLMLHHLRIDWEAGKVQALKTLFMSDPDHKAPFPIVMEGSATRYLTGGDFDVESIQPVADGFWVGEEFGPYILKFDTAGKLTDVIATMVDGEPVVSPDNPALTLQGDPSKKAPAFNLKRSGGYEGLALSKDGTRLYGLLEGPIWADSESVEQADGRPALRIIELDAASKAWTGRSWLYPLAEGGEAIGDFNMLDEKTALVIERDNGAGTVDKACADPKNPQPDCFAVGSKVKRIYKIAMDDENVGGAVRKIGYIDLLKIADPDNRKRQGGGEGFYDMPFVTIENVDRVDATHIIVGNDNNLPFSAGRSLDRADDNEFVLLEAGDFLKAE
ncbi:glycerophosphodiester phosphodiesterase [Sinorhizobium medicae]|uniref:esterase-like activity of phytase family protein n=1 Tax=Sinorhizobium medicae TaxID=110321 RepID=UPI000C7BABC3|nr:esterase-like activity of phytase family protein [Sinorhizobium medicae]MBO1939706.1 esterase-like activity of phytase family protein [Sinorhizobium medicae]MDX0482729.1 glycerophosphodiester phosphodiesterase [Sinorhizobium medicae]MDX0488918.1 glycerophosphodiester phosphodiesterase [Sinorhizobium medicae]MDX0496798.1 glycerophosphodiester phosphodiesterase [Sinorhizobium medicae]MDX0507505.1 glycerophosphodiester phosphodiesterase [Sinorhizobium medicae]